MYDRAVRFKDQGLVNETSTSDNLGPGSYDIKDTIIGSRKGEGYAPFSSLHARESHLLNRDEIMKPGPGSYEAKIIYDHIKGASSIGNRSKRFDERVNETPGPGNYEISRSLVKTAPGKQDCGGTRSQISRVPYAPPSIPSPGQAFGFEEGRDGVLKKQKVPDIDRTIGPAYYAVKNKDTAPVQKYKGVHFGALTAKRNTDINKSIETPGPGAYTISDERTAKLDSLIIEELNKKPIEAKLPRYHEIITIDEKKKAVPGPGQYELKGQFEKIDPVYDPSLRPSFGVQSKRFTNPKEITPAPDLYDDRRHALESCDKMCGLKQSPFGQSSRRFEKPHHVKRTPGPNSYNISGLSDEIQKKMFLSSNLKGAFNSSAKRTFPFSRNIDSNMPGPTHYSIQSAPATMYARDKKSAVFKSTSRRLPDSENTVPAPGSYNIDRGVTKKQVVTLYQVPGKPISGGFLSSTKRFSQPRDVIIKKIDTSTPGPGNYEIKAPDTPSVSMRTDIDRFKVTDYEVPGPGTYKLSPLLQHSVLKSTYNITLNNPIESVLSKSVQNASHISLKVTA